MAARHDPEHSSPELGHSHPLDGALLPCLHCGYDLRGSADHGTCPECGTAYRRIDLYKDVVRQRVKHIADDLRFVIFAAVVIDVGFLLYAMMAIGSLRRWATQNFTVPLFLFLILALLSLWVGALYLNCLISLLYQTYWKKTLIWGQVKGSGIQARLLLAGGLLVLPVLLLLLGR